MYKSKSSSYYQKGYGGNSQPNWNRDFKENIPWGTGWRIGFSMCCCLSFLNYLISNILLKNMNSIVLQQTCLYISLYFFSHFISNHSLHILIFKKKSHFSLFILNRAIGKAKELHPSDFSSSSELQSLII